jgi:hypothetical protein
MFLARRPATILVPLYALLCVVLIIPHTVWNRGLPDAAGYFIGSCAAWAVLAGLIAGFHAMFFRAGERASNALAGFNAGLLLIATLNVLSRSELIYG